MALSKTLMAAGVAAAALLATSVSAFAAPAYATGNVNVRSGPGTQYSRVDALVRGQQVDVQQCRGSWCYVVKSGPDGWVSSNYLNRGRPQNNWDDDYEWEEPTWNPRPPRWNPAPQRPPHWNPRPPRPQPVYPSYPSYPSYPDYDSGSVCFNGPNGYFCVSN